MFLGPELPPLIFSEIQQNLSEYEVNQFDVNNEITVYLFDYDNNANYPRNMEQLREFILKNKKIKLYFTVIGGEIDYSNWHTIRFYDVPVIN